MKNNLAKSLTITPRSPQPTKETIQRFNTHSTKANPFQSEPILEPESFPRESPKFSRYEADEARKLTSESKKSLKKDSVVLKINLGAQGVKKVRCKIGDDPEELAKSFVSENDLAPDAINVIIKMMKKQLKEMAKRLAEVSKEEGKNENDFSFSPNDLQEEKRIENIVQNPSSESEGPKESSKKKMKLKTLGLLAKLAVKVKPNESKELRIHENEDPTAVVNNFCQENDLSSPARDAIMKNLVKMLRKSKGKPIVAEEPKNEPEPVKNELPAITEPEENLSTEFQTRPTQPDSTQPDEIEDILREKAERYEQWQNLLSEKKEMRLKELDKKSKLRGSDTIRQLYHIASNALDNKKRNSKPRKSKSPEETKKKLSPQGKTMSVEEAKKSGERMHARWKAKQDKLAKERIELKEKRAKEEMVEATFSPNRTHTFKRYLSTEPPKHSYMDTARYFHQKKRMEQIGWEMWAEECPFQPTVNHNSRNLLKSQRPASPQNTSIHESLYQRGLEHKKHMKEWEAMAFQDHYKFHPTLITDIHEFLPNRSFRTQAEFTETMYNEAKERDKRYQQRRLERYQSVDPNTGRKWFQPTINHDEYYWKVKTRDDSHYNLMIDVSNWAVKTYIDEKDKINEEEKEGDPELKGLFNELDSDKDGYITIEKVNLDDLDQNMTQILYPFIEFLNNERPRLNFIDFCRSMQSLGIRESIVTSRKSEIKIEEAENEESEGESSNPRGSNQTSNKEKGSSSHRSKAHSKKSNNSSTASSIISDQKVLPRHYQKLLSKKSHEK